MPALRQRVRGARQRPNGVRRAAHVLALQWAPSYGRATRPSTRSAHAPSRAVRAPGSAPGVRRSRRRRRAGCRAVVGGDVRARAAPRPIARSAAPVMQSGGEAAALTKRVSDRPRIAHQWRARRLASGKGGCGCACVCLCVWHERL
eukprot:1392996-Prymnesium_polylepis.2